LRTVSLVSKLVLPILLAIWRRHLVTDLLLASTCLYPLLAVFTVI
jgi:hypothetical protein